MAILQENAIAILRGALSHRDALLERCADRSGGGYVANQHTERETGANRQGAAQVEGWVTLDAWEGGMGKEILGGFARLRPLGSLPGSEGDG